ncbi:hypothetical protein sscle_11g085530 [Sclerotinia sclerotiorum 1980 UF-70]|uniref:Uncharacterized protein n=1 Tax=Sclerotinia sclerotiorum (strain ATCC 18683 / 1980 / Ss-1) TaxID=665079 RepID=A0A1D9QGM5_SCLS1|nr:hypothetical protein sscle_11g085530 [Sclerotinia sclerotiorum 1980 UF-70]
MTLSAFCESTSAETVHALRILKAEFQALDNNNVDDGDSDTYSVTSNSSATTDFSTFTTLTEEGDLEPLSLWDQTESLMERIMERVPWE